MCYHSAPSNDKFAPILFLQTLASIVFARQLWRCLTCWHTHVGPLLCIHWWTSSGCHHVYHIASLGGDVTSVFKCLTCVDRSQSWSETSAGGCVRQWRCLSLSNSPQMWQTSLPLPRQPMRVSSVWRLNNSWPPHRVNSGAVSTYQHYQPSARILCIILKDPLFSELFKHFQVTHFCVFDDVFNRPYADTNKK